MPSELIWPAIVVSLAFVFYTAGVWGERIVRELKSWHVISFWLGLAFDTYGTWLMERLREAGQNPDIVHSVTGATALVLMALHTIWASWVLARGTTDARRKFHLYSFVVWLIWLVPYFGGMIAGITKR